MREYECRVGQFKDESDPGQCMSLVVAAWKRTPPPADEIDAEGKKFHFQGAHAGKWHLNNEKAAAIKLKKVVYSERNV